MIAVLLSFFFVARADYAAEILQKVDDSMSVGHQQSLVQLEVQKKRRKKTYRFDLYQKQNMGAVVFHAPARDPLC